MLRRVSTWQYCRLSLVWWKNKINLTKRPSPASVHLMTDRVSLFVNQRLSDLPIRVSYKHFKTICEQTCDNSPTDSSSSFLKSWSSKQRLETLYSCSVFSFANSKHLSMPFFAWSSMSWVCPILAICSCYLRISLNNCFIRFALTLSTSQIHVSRNEKRFVKIHIFHPFLPHGSHILLLSCHFDVIHTYHQEFFLVDKRTCLGSFFPSKS